MLPEKHKHGDNMVLTRSQCIAVGRLCRTELALSGAHAPALPKGEALAHSQVLHYYNKVGRPLQRVDGPIGALLGKLLLCEVLANIDRNSHDDDKALHDVSVRRVDVHELQSDLH